MTKFAKKFAMALMLAAVASPTQAGQLHKSGRRAAQYLTGDICCAEDLTGERHLNRVRGAFHTTAFVLKTEYVWTQD